MIALWTHEAPNAAVVPLQGGFSKLLPLGFGMIDFEFFCKLLKGLTDNTQQWLSSCLGESTKEDGGDRQTSCVEDETRAVFAS